ncbi:MAG TPA: hypothetical protein VHP99_09645 [Pyrinomonadaceae bacterium]|nr:hypothetical protein [Pyrinomonadaceae bacterium]
MRKTVGIFVGAALLSLSLAVVAVSQVQTTTVTKVQTQTVQNPDGTYSVVEYPVGKETVVTMNPVGIAGAIGHATILRNSDGTTIRVNLEKLPTDLTSLNFYAVDPTGAVTSLGPIEVANGIGTFTTTTPMSRFMLFASPEANLTAYDPNTQVFFRSAVPTGLTVIPIGGSVAAVGEQVSSVVATAGPAVAGVVTAAADYTVPMLGIPAWKKEQSTKLKIDFSGPMEGARANIFIEPRKHGKTTEILMQFHDLQEAPKGQAFVLWAVSPDHQFQKLGQIVNIKNRSEARIESETNFDDFGLLLTTENVLAPTATIISPSGKRVGVITITP